MLEPIVNFDECQEASEVLFGVDGNVTFKQRFGPWSNGEVLKKDHSLWLSYDSLLLEEQDAEGTCVKACKVKLVPDV